MVVSRKFVPKLFVIFVLIICSILLISCGNTNSESGEKEQEIETCEHEWYEASRTTSTCVTHGIITYKCTKCGEEKQETIAELGDHAYVGNFCNVCGERKPGDFEFTSGNVKGYLYKSTKEGRYSLDIDGKGEMDNYSSFSDTPLKKLMDDNKFTIDRIKIYDGVTGIGHNAFNGLSDLVLVEFPGSLTKIGRYAFQGCSMLESLEIPSKVTSIGDYAFAGCIGVKSINISSSKCDIGKFAFYDCKYVNSLSFPMNDNISGNKDEYSSYFGYMFGYEEGGDPLGQKMFDKDVYFYIPANIREVEITGSASVPSYYFYSCDYITSILISGTPNEIGEYAFANMPELESIIFKEFDVAIRQGVVEENVVISDEYEYDGDKVDPFDMPTTIGDFAFKDSSKLTSFIAAYNINYLGVGAFKNCSSLESFVFIGGRGVEEINPNTFENCTSLVEFYTGKNCKYIRDKAFKECTKLKTFRFGVNVEACNDDSFPNKNIISDKIIIDSETIGTLNKKTYDIFGGAKYIYVLKSIDNKNAYYLEYYTKDKDLSNSNNKYNIYCKNG
ncbi:MAG: leucine-rich repeat domain-containing protein [Clostridia bacterium]|nr:leucine-rich repeat domain-containing protein [Clostridia bacterium]